MGKKNKSVAELNKCARRAHWDLKYEDLESEGPGHRFRKRAVVNGQVFPPGVGDSAKKAKQNAAKNALRHLDMKENLRPRTENAANNPSAPVHQKCVTKVNLGTLLNNYSRMNIGPEPKVTTLCCSAMVGDKEYPAVTGKTKMNFKQKAANLVSADGSKTTEMPSWSALSDDVAKTKSETPSDFVDFTYSSNPSKDQDAVVPKKGNTGNRPSEKTSIQSEISRFKLEFDCKDLLGKGAFGEVHKAKHKLTKKDYAVKIVPFKEDKKALREVIALSDLDHCNIVRYHTCWLEDSGYQGDNADDSDSSSESSMDYSFRYLYIQMELCDTRTLRVWIDERNTLRDSKRRDEAILQMLLQMASAVEYIHFKMLIHRDLKPANIMFGQAREVKIGDLGLVTAENDDDAENLLERTVYKGTPSYMAPEQCAQIKMWSRAADVCQDLHRLLLLHSTEGSTTKKSQKTYDRKVDMFALGLICFEVLWKIPTGHERVVVWPDIRKQKFPQGFRHSFPDEYSIIRSMLCVKPEERPEASELKTDLERLNTEEIMRRSMRSV